MPVSIYIYIYIYVSVYVCILIRLRILSYIHIYYLCLEFLSRNELLIVTAVCRMFRFPRAEAAETRSDNYLR